MSKQHSTLPWNGQPDGLGALSLYSADNKGIWHDSRGEEENTANRDFIVTAVNNYYSLVETLLAVRNAPTYKQAGQAVKFIDGELLARISDVISEATRKE